MRFEINRARNGEFYFNLIARNHEIVATSETYTTKQNAQNTIRSITRDFFEKALTTDVARKGLSTDDLLEKHYNLFVVDNTLTSTNTKEEDTKEEHQ